MKTGRPSKIEELEQKGLYLITKQRIFNAAWKGHSQQHCAWATGLISPETLQEWLQDPQFRLTYDRIKFDLIEDALADIRKKSKNNWLNRTTDDYKHTDRKGEGSLHVNVSPSSKAVEIEFSAKEESEIAQMYNELNIKD